MKQKYLKIENSGVCPYNCFTTLGIGFADTCVDPAKKNLIIGKFSSGLKNSICVLLRNSLSPTVFSSNLKMEFSTKTETIKDELASKDFERIVVKYSGKDDDGKTKNNTELLGMTTDFGKFIWDDTSLALREFVSNSIDFCLRKTGNWADVEVELVDENKVRAKAGSTRIFIPVNDDVLKFYFNLGKWFLHFSEPESIYKTVLQKNNRNLSGKKGSTIYRRGVLVRSVESDDKESLFDYNLNDLTLSEERKASDWDVQYYSGIALAKCQDNKIQSIYLNSFSGEYWEHSFGDYSMSNISYNKESWKSAFEGVYDDQVLCTSEFYERVEKKGYRARVVKSELFDVLVKTGIRTHLDVLSRNEKDCLNSIPATPEMLECFDDVWAMLKRNHLTMGKEPCKIEGLVTIANEDGTRLGLFRDGVCYIKHTLSGKELFKTMLEEISHYVTGDVDFSRAMQEYFLDVIVALRSENKSPNDEVPVVSNLGCVRIDSVCDWI